MELGPGLEVTPSVCLVRKLGSGGMGSVWVAEHKGLRSEVVVKFMATELLKDEGSKQRFSREAAAAAQVRSPHVVQILDHGITSGGLPFIVMELLDGHDLGAHLDKVGRLGPREAVAVMNQLGKALSRAHDRGIVHRDLKPENIFLCDVGGDELFVKVLDFGIAKAASEPFGVSTITGMLVGSPYYMSPEQLRALKDIDFRTDIWSVGVVMYQALTGLRPFVAENLAALAVVIHSEPAPLPSTVNPDLPAEFDDWFARACSRDRGARFQSMKEMAQTLERVLLPLTDISRPPLPSASTTGNTNVTTGNTGVAAAQRVEASGLMRTTAPVSASTLADAKTDVPSTEAPAAPRRTVAIAAGAAAALALVAGVVFMVRSNEAPSAETVTSSAPSGVIAAPPPSAAPPPVVEPAVIPTPAAPVAEPAPSASVEVPQRKAEPERSSSRSPSRPSRSDDDRRKKAAPASSAPAETPKATPPPTPPPPAPPTPAPTSRERPI